MKISIQNISKAYGETRALTDFSLEIESGGVFGLIGPNGAGKTTLMKILATLERPTSGAVFLDDVDVIRNPDHMKRVVGYLPQDVAVYPNLTAVEFLSYIASMKALEKKAAGKQIDELLDVLHLTGAKKRRLSTYSGGMRQRVGIACALLGDPKVIIVDEPSAGLDPEKVERRDTFRLPVSRPCDISRYADGLRHETVYAAKMLDISAGGTKILVHVPLVIGENIRCGVTLGEHGRQELPSTIMWTAPVLRAGPGTFKAGIAFHSLSRTDAGIIIKFIYNEQFRRRKAARGGAL